MYLKRLEIQGFKSFANKTVLEFERGITSVVGPNGSGKSNIADSLRWVLGEQSLKQLRGKKSEDVIFAGSDKKARLSFVEVSVTFDNEDRKIPLDYSEVSITRRMDRSGESDYMLNGNKVRLLDIIDLVLKSNIGTSRYTVIGQGTIDQMILAGPSEVKNLVDEASGVKTYYIRRDKALKRLEQTTQNLIRVSDLLAEIEPRLKSLRRQAKKMEERENIEQELRVLQKEYFSGRFWQLQNSLAVFEAKISELNAKRHALQSDIDAQRTRLDKSENNNRSEISEYQEIQNEIKKLSDKKNKLIEDVALIRGKMQAQKSSGGTSAADAKTLDMEKSALESTKQNLAADTDRAKKEGTLVESQIAEQRKTLERVSQKLQELQTNLDNPENINFTELADDVKKLENGFSELYDSLENGSDAQAALGKARLAANQFKSSLGIFKEKTLKFAQNPFLNFNQQRIALQDILLQKDKVSQELNRLDLERSKAGIRLEYLEKELAKTEQKLMHVNLDLKGAASGNVDEYFSSLLAEEQNLNKEAAKISEAIGNLEQNISLYHSKEQTRKNEMLEEERSYRANQDKLSKLKDEESAVQIEKAKYDTQKENVLGEIIQALGTDGAADIQKQQPAQSKEHSTQGLEEKIAKIKSQLDMIGGIDELTLQEYKETEQRYVYLNSQTEDLQKAMNDLRSIIEELDEHIKKRFQEAFDAINDKFQNYFRVLFNGGRAYLSIMRPEKDKTVERAEEAAAGESEEDDDQTDKAMQQQMRPEEKILAKYEHGASDIIGIDIKATPPGKKLSSISALSGGERALTSIALLCSLLSCFPSPFVVLDEVDAALDEANTIRFAQILGTLASKTQFITVTHNRETMRQAHTLYGITMGDDSISKVLSLKIEQAQAYAK